MERTVKEAASMTVFCRDHPLAPLRGRLAEAGVVTARDLRTLASGAKVRVSGIRIIVHTPPTKSGKRVMFITMEDETGLMDLVMFPRVQERSARPVLTGELITVDGVLQRRGRGGVSVSIVVDEVVPHLTGALSDFLAHASEDDQKPKRKKETLPKGGELSQHQGPGAEPTRPNGPKRE